MLSPDGRCKSFDSRANGFVRGEGVAVVILKPLARALADRDRIYALIRATAVNQDGRTEGITVPNRASQEANLRNALRLADIAPESVQYVEAHGTGTPVGDPIEAAALGAVYGKARKPERPLRDRLDQDQRGSPGSRRRHHRLDQGGAVPAASPDSREPAFRESEPANPVRRSAAAGCAAARALAANRRAAAARGVNSFGFGGTNGHAILEAPHPRPSADAATRSRRRPRLDAAALGAQRIGAARSGALLSELAARRARLESGGAARHLLFGRA